MFNINVKQFQSFQTMPTTLFSSGRCAWIGSGYTKAPDLDFLSFGLFSSSPLELIFSFNFPIHLFMMNLTSRWWYILSMLVVARFCEILIFLQRLMLLPSLSIKVSFCSTASEVASAEVPWLLKVLLKILIFF